jgi:DNA-binding NtrC family response regulator
VLIVEDVDDDAELIALQLHRSGFNVDYDRVDSLVALRGALAQPAWDLILTDYSMPGLSVTAVLRQIREQKVKVPCLLVSGTASDETALAAMKFGMADFVSKHNLEELGPVVSRVLSQSAAQLSETRLQVPRLRLTSGDELRLVEWSTARRWVDGETSLRPDTDREGLILRAEEATPVRVHVLDCHVQTLTASSVVYRSMLSLLSTMG